MLQPVNNLAFVKAVVYYCGNKKKKKVCIEGGQIFLFTRQTVEDDTKLILPIKSELA